MVLVTPGQTTTRTPKCGALGTKGHGRNPGDLWRSPQPNVEGQRELTSYSENCVGRIACLEAKSDITLHAPDIPISSVLKFETEQTAYYRHSAIIDTVIFRQEMSKCQIWAIWLKTGELARPRPSFASTPRRYTATPPPGRGPARSSRSSSTALAPWLYLGWAWQAHTQRDNGIQSTQCKAT